MGCSVLQCVAVCCSVLQRVAVWWDEADYSWQGHLGQVCVCVCVCVAVNYSELQ